VPLIGEDLAYLEKRLAQVEYPMKRAGMHWARASINSMLTLRDESVMTAAIRRDSRAARSC
jgi:hypothetical protein